LDTAPEHRFDHVIAHFKPALAKLYTGLVDKPIVKGIAKKLAAMRGPETPELMAEVTGIATALDWPVDIVQSAQILYELQTLMVPLTNISWPWLSAEEASALHELLDTQRVGFGCTGIIARDDDGSVYHARNLDFSFAKYLQNMTYNAKYSRGGKHLYTAQMIAAYQSLLTGIRPGPNGYSFETNTRYYAIRMATRS